ncbi:MAG: hypothetical protein QMC85_07535, partial [Methanocellales archaeon]|nr:hypothetical protein [Methanocellales archaeon]
MTIVLTIKSQQDCLFCGAVLIRTITEPEWEALASTAMITIDCPSCRAAWRIPKSLWTIIARTFTIDSATVSPTEAPEGETITASITITITNLTFNYYIYREDTGERIGVGGDRGPGTFTKYATFIMPPNDVTVRFDVDHWPSIGGE